MLRTVIAAVLVSQVYCFIATAPSTNTARKFTALARAPSLRLSCQTEGNSVGRQIASAATSAALIAGLVFPAYVNAGNNYPPIDTKDPTRCEVGISTSFHQRPEF